MVPAKRDDGGLSRGPVPGRDALAALGDRDWIAAVGRTWAAFSHLLPTPDQLVMRAQQWRADGLTAADWQAATTALLAPEREAAIRGAWDLFPAIAAAGADLLRRRRDAEQREREAAEAAIRNAPVNETERAKVVAILDSFTGRPPRG